MSCIPYSSETVVIQCNRVAHPPKSDEGQMKKTICDISAAEFSNDLLNCSSGSEYIYLIYLMNWMKVT